MARPLSGIKVKIHSAKLVGAVGDTLAQNMNVAGVWVRDRVKEKLNRGQPTRTLASGSVIGLNPSLPGEPPKKITAQLQNSIRHKVIRTARRISCLIGTNLKKARWLELGTSKMAARPFLRPTIAENKDAILRIIASGHHSGDAGVGRAERAKDYARRDRRTGRYIKL